MSKQINCINITGLSFLKLYLYFPFLPTFNVIVFPLAHSVMLNYSNTLWRWVATFSPRLVAWHVKYIGIFHELFSILLLINVFVVRRNIIVYLNYFYRKFSKSSLTQNVTNTYTLIIIIVTLNDISDLFVSLSSLWMMNK